MAFEESQQLKATSIAFCPDFYSFPIQDGEESTAPPAPPAAGCVSIRPFPPTITAEEKAPSTPSFAPGPPLENARSFAGCFVWVFFPHSGTSRRGYPPEPQMRRGGDAELLLPPQNRGKRLKFSKNVLGKNERKVAAVGETGREREGEG